MQNAKQATGRIIGAIRAEWSPPAPRAAAALQFFTGWGAVAYWVGLLVVASLLARYSATWYEMQRYCIFVVGGVYSWIIGLRLAKWLLLTFVFPSAAPRVSRDYVKECREALSTAKHGGATAPHVVITPTIRPPAPRPDTPPRAGESAPPEKPRAGTPPPAAGLLDGIDLDAVARFATQETKPPTLDAADLTAKIKGKIVGQDAAVTSVVDTLARRWYAKYNAAKRDGKPVAVFLLLGPTGTGKTELAKQITAAVYPDSPDAFLIFDMANFSEPHAVARLIGSPPGYVGSDQGGQLTRPMLANPRRVILFDEIEKAHTAAHKLWLSIFDEGRLQESSTGQAAYFGDSVIFLTSNLCAGEITPTTTPDEIRRMLAASKALPPELLGRITGFAVFLPISTAAAAHIAIGIIRDMVTGYGIEWGGLDHPEAWLGRVLSTVDLNFGVRELRAKIEAAVGDEIIGLHQAGARRVVLTSDGLREVQ